MLVAGDMGGGGSAGGFSDFAGYAGLGARVRTKRVPPSRAVKGLQVALRLLARSTRDKRLLVGTDGRVGARTVMAVNAAFTRHIGSGQAPAALRTGRLTPADIAKNAQTIGVLVLTEVKRRRAAAAAAVAAKKRAPVARRAVRRATPGTIVPGPRMGPGPSPEQQAQQAMQEPMPMPEQYAEEAPETIAPPEFAPEAAPEEAPQEEVAAEEAPAEEAPAEEAAAEEAPAEGGEEAPPDDAETAGAVGDDMTTGSKVILSATILGVSAMVAWGLHQAR